MTRKDQLEKQLEELKEEEKCIELEDKIEQKKKELKEKRGSSFKSFVKTIERLISK